MKKTNSVQYFFFDNETPLSNGSYIWQCIAEHEEKTERYAEGKINIHQVKRLFILLRILFRSRTDVQRLILSNVCSRRSLRFSADENTHKAHDDADEERVEIDWKRHPAQGGIGLRDHTAEEAQQHAPEGGALAHLLRPDAHKRHDAPCGGNHGAAEIHNPEDLRRVEERERKHNQTDDRHANAGNVQILLHVIRLTAGQNVIRQRGTNQRQERRRRRDSRGKNTGEQHDANEHGHNVHCRPDQVRAGRIDIRIDLINKRRGEIERHSDGSDAHGGPDGGALHGVLVLRHEIAAGLPGADHDDDGPDDAVDDRPDQVLASGGIEIVQIVRPGDDAGTGGGLRKRNDGIIPPSRGVHHVGDADERGREEDQEHDGVRDQNAPGAGIDREDCEGQPRDDHTDLIIQTGDGSHERGDALHGGEHVRRDGEHERDGREHAKALGGKTLAEILGNRVHFCAADVLAEEVCAVDIAGRLQNSNNDDAHEKAAIDLARVAQKGASAKEGGDQRADNQNDRGFSSGDVIVTGRFHASAGQNADDDKQDEGKDYSDEICVHSSLPFLTM